MDPAQIKKFAQDLQKQTDTVIFCNDHSSLWAIIFVPRLVCFWPKHLSL